MNLRPLGYESEGSAFGACRRLVDANRFPLCINGFLAPTGIHRYRGDGDVLGDR